MKYFYSKEKASRLVGSLAYDDDDIQNYLKGNPFVDYPQLNDTNTVISETKLSFPIWTGTELREKTDVELKLEGLKPLDDGEIIESGVIKTVPIPDELFKPKWEYPNWVESMPLVEQEEYRNKLIDTLKAELLEDGFIYLDKTKAKHQQKTRDKDLSYLGNAIASMEDVSIPTIKWYFNNGDMVELTLEEMKELRANGAIFVSTVFGVEAQLKSEQPTKNLTLEMFKDKVDAISTIKCFRDKNMAY